MNRIIIWALKIMREVTLKVMIVMLYIVINIFTFPLPRCYELLPLYLSRTNATLDVVFGVNMGISHVKCCNYCHLLSDFSSKCQSSSMPTFITKCEDAKHTKPKVDELEVSRGSKYSSKCKLIHKKCRQESYHNDIEHHITLNTRRAQCKSSTRVMFCSTY